LTELPLAIPELMGKELPVESVDHSVGSGLGEALESAGQGAFDVEASFESKDDTSGESCEQVGGGNPEDGASDSDEEHHMTEPTNFLVKSSEMSLERYRSALGVFASVFASVFVLFSVLTDAFGRFTSIHASLESFEHAIFSINRVVYGTAPALTSFLVLNASGLGLTIAVKALTDLDDSHAKRRVDVLVWLNGVLCSVIVGVLLYYSLLIWPSFDLIWNRMVGNFLHAFVVFLGSGFFLAITLCFFHPQMVCRMVLTTV